MPLSKSSNKKTNVLIHVVWIGIAIIVMCMIAYVVFHQCKTNKAESFQSPNGYPTNNTIISAITDIIPRELSVSKYYSDYLSKDL